MTFFEDTFGVPQQRPDADPNDGAIARRLSEFRRNIGWAQADFAEAIGITRDQLANIESGRTPLRYDVAWRAYEMFRWHPARLAFGDSFEGMATIKYPPTGSPLIGKRALLSEVANAARKGEFGNGKELGPGILPLHGVGEKLREALEDLEISVRQWVLAVPEDKMDELRERLAAAGDSFVKDLPPATDEMKMRRADALRWAKLRQQNVRRFRFPRAAKSDVAVDSSNAYRPPVTLPRTLEEVLDLVRKATAERGQKKALAKSLNVSPQRLSDWISGHRKPGGEHTMELLKRVWPPSSTKNKSGITAQTVTPSRTQLRNKPNEKKHSKSSRRSGSQKRGGKATKST